MQRIVLDTNVIVSALISDGIPFQIISELVFEKKVSVCISGSVFEEYIEVSGRSKFFKFLNFKDKADTFISKIEELAEKYSPDIKLNLLTDESDNKFLELSIFANVEFLITGNTNDFTEKKYQNVNVVTPREYWDEHKPE
jgi:putative PIN family toxin of toxin-antitoxin system